MFKRRDRRPVWRVIFELLWPRGGWARAAQYVKHRLNRLPDPPERIARGIFAGVFTTFTPFFGLHFIIAALLATLMRGNILAALLATFFGNPLTYVPIAATSLWFGHKIIGQKPAKLELGNEISNAWDNLWSNFHALFTQEKLEWSGLQAFYADVFYPFMIGSIIPGLVCGIIAYYLSVPVIRAYQTRRKGLLKAKLESLKAKAAAAKAKASRPKQVGD